MCVCVFSITIYMLMIVLYAYAGMCWYLYGWRMAYTFIHFSFFSRLFFLGSKTYTTTLQANISRECCVHLFLIMYFIHLSLSLFGTLYNIYIQLLHEMVHLPSSAGISSKKFYMFGLL